MKKRRPAPPGGGSLATKDIITVSISVLALLISILTLYRTQFYVKDDVRLAMTRSEIWFSDELTYLKLEWIVRFTLDNKGNRNAVLISAVPVMWRETGSSKGKWMGLPLYHGDNKPADIQDLALGPATIRNAGVVASARIHPNSYVDWGFTEDATTWKAALGLKTVSLDSAGTSYETIIPLAVLRAIRATSEDGRKYWRSATGVMETTSPKGGIPIFSNAKPSPNTLFERAK